MLKIAIVGCGKIADSHAAQIQRIPGCGIVAVCDREVLMARQLAQRFRVPQYFADIAELLDAVKPDVVHITTPPQSHFPVAVQCLSRGCHLYIEKPFTITATEAQELIALAVERNVKLTAGHDDQFRHGARRMRNLVQSGYLGGPPVHMESLYCYDMGENGGYAKALLADKNHWVRHLPGGLLHNIISHGIARIAEFFPALSPKVMAYGFVSPFLRARGESQLMDELRVIIVEEGGCTAYFTFSSQMRPSLHQFRVYGAKNGLLLDQDNETLIALKGKRYKSYLEQFVPPVVFAKQYLTNWAQNIGRFVTNDFHPKSGMKCLIGAFYDAILQDGRPPIPYREIILTAKIMDDIFTQIRLSPIPQTTVNRPAVEFANELS